MTAEIYLETKELTKEYHKRKVVNGVSLRVDPGKVTGLLGPNGAGKSTTFRMVAGLVKPDSGEVILNGENVTRLPMYKRARLGIGYLPQEPTVFTRLSVRDNIMIVLENLAIPKKERRPKLKQLLQEMDLERLINSKAESLSGGERRRLEVTRALACSPCIMMWDEPFAAVDPIVVEYLQEIISNLKKRGLGILITDHKAPETLAVSDYVYVINEGEILEEGLPIDVAKSEIVRKVYLGKNFGRSMEDTLGDEEQEVDLKRLLEGGKQWLKNQHYDQAIESFSEILLNDKSHTEARFYRAQAFTEIDEYASAMADLKKIKKISSDYNGLEEWLNKVQSQINAG